MGTDADRLKGVEALYNLTKGAYDAEISRYDATEAKAGRYMAILGLIIGAFVLKFDGVVWIWQNATMPWVAGLFVIGYGVIVFSALVTFVSLVLAMSVEGVQAIPVGEEVEKLFRENGYEAALEATTESFRSAARDLRDTTHGRLGHVERANRLVKIIMVVGIITLLAYFALLPSARNAVLKREESKMSDTKPATQNTTQTETKPKTTQTIAKVKPPAFEWLKRDAGDIIRKK